MRLPGLLIVLSAVLSAGAADACGIFKCFKRTAAPAAAAVPVVRREAGRTDPDPLPYMKVTSVGGQAVNEALGQVANEVDPRPYVVVVVETDAWTGTWCDVNLHVDAGTPRVAAAVAPTAARARPRVEFKGKRVARPKAVVAAAPTAGTSTVPTTGYEFEFHVYDLEYFHTYKAYAYSAWCLMSSPEVTFHTRREPGSESPPGPPDTGGIRSK